MQKKDKSTFKKQIEIGDQFETKIIISTPRKATNALSAAFSSMAVDGADALLGILSTSPIPEQPRSPNSLEVSPERVAWTPSRPQHNESAMSESPPPSSIRARAPSPSRPVRKPTAFLRQPSIQLCHIPMTPRTLLTKDDTDSSDQGSRSPPMDRRRMAMYGVAKPTPAKRKIQESSMFAEEPSSSPMRRRASIFEERKMYKGRNNVSRLKQEFVDLGIIGKGDFGTVNKYQHKLDGVVYAIKRSNKAIAGLADEKRLLKEVIAHAAINVQPHIVRYFSAWEEDDHMLIQNEYCNGGTLEEEIRKRGELGEPFSEDELRDLLFQMATGLNSLHQQGFVHLDFKPGNIFITHTKVAEMTPLHQQAQTTEVLSAERNVNDDSGYSQSNSMNISRFDQSDNVDDDNDVFADASPIKPLHTAMLHQHAEIQLQTPAPQRYQQSNSKIIYKIGDLGHATTVSNPQVEDGDARYLAPEILDQNFANLPKADILALGMSLYEAATLERLPVNGALWQRLRHDDPPPLDSHSRSFNDLVLSMMARDPTMRPTAEQILQHPFIVASRKSNDEKTKAELVAELNAEKLVTMRLRLKLAALKLLLKTGDDDDVPKDLQIRRIHSVSYASGKPFDFAASLS